MVAIKLFVLDQMRNLLLLVFSLSSVVLSAQVLPYTFQVLNEPYTQLEDAISLNGNSNWEDPDYLIPIGFNFFGFGEWNSEMTFGGVFGYGGELFLGSFDGSQPLNHLAPYSLDIHDPNVLTNELPVGHIYQKIDGTAPNRICKIEWRNVGFYLDETGEMRMNFQMWLYETSNRIEYRYGPSENFNLESVQELTGIFIGLSKDFDFNTFTFNYLWTLSGDADAPSIESYDSFSIDFQIADQVLQNPAEGTVYRFDNLEIAVPEFEKNTLRVHPNPASSYCTITMEEMPEDRNIKIIDALGRVVLNIPVQSLQERIDLSELPNGAYAVMGLYSTGVQTKSLVVNR
ncbi:MAG: hypothetical protein RLZZ262_2567 [Bacteroidota bacterium]|jgi:hypothetical protein